MRELLPLAVGLRLAAMAAITPLYPDPRGRGRRPKPAKRHNPKRDAQAAAKRARKITRRNRP